MSDTHLQAVSTALRQVVENAQGPLPPAFVLEFLINQWRRYLFVVHRDQGESSAGWTHAVTTAENLIWSVAPKTDQAERDKLVNYLDTLLADLKEGMTAAKIEPSDQAAFLAQLSECHLSAMHPERKQAGAVKQGSATPGGAAQQTEGLDSTISLDVRDPKYDQLLDLLRTGNVDQIDL